MAWEMDGVYAFTRGSVFPRRGAVSGLDKHLLAACLHHVNILTDLLEGHLLRDKTDILYKAKLQ